MIDVFRRGEVFVGPEDVFVADVLLKLSYDEPFVRNRNVAEAEIYLYALGDEIPEKLKLLVIPFVEEEVAEIVSRLMGVVVVVAEREKPLSVHEGRAVTADGVVGREINGRWPLALIGQSPVMSENRSSKSKSLMASSMNTMFVFSSIPSQVKALFIPPENSFPL